MQGDEFPVTGGIQGEVIFQKRVMAPFNMEILWLNETQGLLANSVIQAIFLGLSET